MDENEGFWKNWRPKGPKMRVLGKIAPKKWKMRVRNLEKKFEKTKKESYLEKERENSEK